MTGDWGEKYWWFLGDTGNGLVFLGTITFGYYDEKPVANIFIPQPKSENFDQLTRKHQFNLLQYNVAI